MINISLTQKYFPKGKLTIVNGRPAVGKTSMAVSFAHSLATEGHRPIFFSMEMSKEKLAERCTDAMANIHIEDTPSLGVCDIRKAVTDANADFVIIDYLQLIKHENNKSFEEETLQIKNELKCLASELDIPVVAISQLSQSQVATFSELTEFPDFEDDFEQEDDKDAYTIDEDGNVTITDSVDEIRNCLFRKRTDIKSVYIPDHIEAVGILAFDDCPNLKVIRVKNLELLKASGVGENVIVITE